MSTLEVKTYPDTELRKEAKEVEDVEEIEDLLKKMKETLKEKDGIGLAAPQVGISKRVIVIKDGHHYHGFINPEIKKKVDETVKTKEGCLSLPGLWMEVERSKRVEIEATTENGERVRLEAEKAGAVVFQHEIDHLDGILFIDKLGFLKRLKAKIKYFLSG